MRRKVKTRGNIDNMLPIDAAFKGWHLDWYLENKDPIDLTDQYGKLLYHWDGIPSLTELFEVCHTLLQN